MSRALGACAAALTLLVAPFARADDVGAAASASAFYGPTSRYIKIPLGGNPSTTRARRPTLTLHELGADDAAFYEVTGLPQWGHVGVSGTLSESPVSHDVAFSAGSPFKRSTHLGAGWRFDLDQRRLELFPKNDGAIRDFSNSFDSPPLRAARAYDTTAARLGAEATYELGHGFGLDLDDDESESIPHMPQLESVTGRLAYESFPASPVRVMLFLGCSARWIDFSDSQTIPNRAQERVGTLLISGFSVSF